MAEPLPQLFLRFLRFGLLAWGGPVAQIAMIRRELVDEQRWVSRERFDRALAVYQALPGPEAHELCVWFGMLARGRIGGLLAGVGFMLPGLVLMLAVSWAYLTFGMASTTLQAAFAGIQAAVVALVARAVHRIGQRTWGDPRLVAIAGAAFAASIVGVHFAPTLAAAGLTYALVARRHVLAALALGAAFVAFAIAAALAGSPAERIAAELSGADSAAPGRASAPQLLFSGLKAGLLTFGGAYTAIPFVQEDAVGAGWMTNRQFLDGLALSGTLPAPLIIFTTFVGYFAGGPLGALVMTAGVFVPAFAFTLVGHRYLERVIATPSVHAFLDGITAGVVGLVAAVTIELFAAGVTSVAALGIFLAALVTAYVWKVKASVAVIVVVGGALGLLLLGPR